MSPHETEAALEEIEHKYGERAVHVATDIYRTTGLTMREAIQRLEALIAWAKDDPS